MSRELGEAVITAEIARRLLSELHSLKKRADEARRAARLPFSQSEVGKALKAEPYLITDFRTQSISDWVPENSTAKNHVPRDADVVWALVRLWSDWAGEKEPNRQYWSDLVERAQPAGRQVGRVQAEEPQQGADSTGKADEAVIDFLQSGWEFAEAVHLQWESSLLVPRWDRESLAQLGHAVEQAGTRVRVLRPDLTFWVDNMNKGLRMVDQGIEGWSNPEIDTPSFFPTVAMPQLIGSLNGLQDHLAEMGKPTTEP